MITFEKKFIQLMSSARPRRSATALGTMLGLKSFTLKSRELRKQMINFEQGRNLANRQQRVFEDLDSPLKNDVLSLRGNLWIRTAIKLAPSNLVVRHFCLLDMISRKPESISIITNQLVILAPDLWIEGYSYWVYTKPFLKEYIDRVNLSNADKEYIKSIVKMVDQHFIDTAYPDANGSLKPAPFGDLRDTYLQGLTGTPKQNTNLAFLRKEGKVYYINNYPIGFNTHTPKESKVTVVNGFCYGFSFYTGYENKYPNKSAELADTFSPKRILSLFK